jgi:hypothetical protein
LKENVFNTESYATKTKQLRVAHWLVFNLVRLWYKGVWLRGTSRKLAGSFPDVDLDITNGLNICEPE